jgi:hypothetical protein
MVLITDGEPDEFDLVVGAEKCAKYCALSEYSRAGLWRENWWARNWKLLLRLPSISSGKIYVYRIKLGQLHFTGVPLAEYRLRAKTGHPDRF